MIADAASRFSALPDWHLPPEIFRLVVSRWGLPEVDLFASTESAQVRRFFAWGAAPDALAYDALAQRWNFARAYAFPPPPILPSVIRKLAASSGVFLLVTPFWPAQKWFPLVLGLHVVDVRRLPAVPPVVDLSTGRCPLPHLPLLVWRVFGGCSASTSPTTPSGSSATVGVRPLPLDTTPFGDRSRISSVPGEFLSIPSI